jgi:hypothetical protein
MSESIEWIDASKDVPDAGSRVLVCFQRNDCDERAVTEGEYDDSDEDSPWTVDGGWICFGTVLFWAEMPEGPKS